ncbi:phosphoribosyltransferase [Microbacterium sp.]|uniref:phosphoribosyltransferase n=1 Tax=Microbacterium sp. TaxID=51671 RepID=UPI000928871A|nr:phosphoribosyltransferase family protein [Microbacterium sp.]MBN9190879.1 phosphoribosyltransferase [Microbacterium sp.]MBN9191604.1 phosphoribosyltransferase [Microbacterium sp.]OJU69401.1 MAG: hypothetical protein BGO04_09180 [Microbacterium sp. 70-38]
MGDRWWFLDRVEAGRQLGRMLAHRELGDVVVLGLPRGGVPVAAQVAAALHAPLDVIVVRKLGVPGHPEVAMGAVGESGTEVVDRDLIARLGVSPEQLAAVETAERAAVRDRLARLRAHRPRIELDGRDVVIVDDGIATGSTMAAACRVARRLNAARVYAAAPVGAQTAIDRIDVADRVFCLLVPEDFDAVGRYYRDFDQTSDAEVERLLGASQTRAGHGS